jgi:ABC-type bacteriocin/lantibiotic exporter with double-glycine peptidase domain
VGNEIMRDCMGEFLRDSTRVVVTHNLSYCKYFDYIYIMKEGRILKEGSYTEVKDEEIFNSLIKS